MSQSQGNVLSPEFKSALDNLTAKKKLFVVCYLAREDLNASKAAIEAGYSAKTATSAAHRLMQDSGIRAAITVAMEERIKKTKIDADYVLQRLVDIDKMDAKDILNEDGSIKALSQWPEIWRQMLSGLDVQEVSVSDNAATVVKKIKWPDKVRNLELIGKHIDVQAFNDKQSVDHTTDGQPITEITRTIVDPANE